MSKSHQLCPKSNPTLQVSLSVSLNHVAPHLMRGLAIWAPHQETTHPKDRASQDCHPQSRQTSIHVSSF
jgi:hypothetical protein